MKKTILIFIFVLVVIFLPFILKADSSELNNSITWLYENGLTKYVNTSTFGANKTIRRDEAAKFFVKFSKLLEKDTYVKTDTQCKFSDINNSWSDLKDIVIESCKLGLFQGSKGKFSPKNQLTNAQAIAIIIRIIEGKQDESGNNRADKYYQRASALGIISTLNLNDKKQTITRGNLAILLYRARQIGDISDMMDDNMVQITKTTEGADVIVSALKMKKDSNGSRYHQFTIKNVGTAPYEFTGSDYLSCWYKNTEADHSAAHINLNFKGSLNPGKTKILDTTPGQSSLFIQVGDYTGNCFLYTNNNENIKNNNFAFRGKDYYSSIDSIKENNSDKLPDLIIESAEVDSNKLIITIKNIGLGPAYINQRSTLEPVCDGPSYSDQISNVIRKKIILSESIQVGGIFIVDIPMSSSSLNHCFLYYYGKELNQKNNHFRF